MSIVLNNLYHTIQPLHWRQAPVCLWVASPPIRHVCESSTCANGVGWGIRLSAGSEASFFYLPAVHVSNPTEQPLYALPSVPRSSVSMDLSSHNAAKKRDGVPAPVGHEWQRYMFDQGAWGLLNLVMWPHGLRLSRLVSLFAIKKQAKFLQLIWECSQKQTFMTVMVEYESWSVWN